MTVIFKSVFAKSLVTVTALAALGTGMSASASAQDAGAMADYAVRSTSDVNIKMGVKAFKAGEFDRAVAFNQKAIKSGLSKSRKAIAYSNLCAALAAQGDRAAAVAACDSALALRPELKEAAQNRAAAAKQ